jgi:hypothetical protein
VYIYIYMHISTVFVLVTGSLPLRSRNIRNDKKKVPTLIPCAKSIILTLN